MIQKYNAVATGDKDIGEICQVRFGKSYYNGKIASKGKDTHWK